MLVAAGADVNAVDTSSHETPLFYAAIEGYTER
jgi:hypothetical protein